VANSDRAEAKAEATKSNATAIAGGDNAVEMIGQALSAITLGFTLVMAKRSPSPGWLGSGSMVIGLSKYRFTGRETVDLLLLQESRTALRTRTTHQARPSAGRVERDSRHRVSEAARRVLRLPGHERLLRGKTHAPSGQQITNDIDLCNALLDAKGVACVPGSAFGEPRAMRMSYTCPTPQLAPGLTRIQEFFAEFDMADTQRL
jgi:hypothetical protein